MDGAMSFAAPFASGRSPTRRLSTTRVLAAYASAARKYWIASGPMARIKGGSGSSSTY